MLGGNIWKNTIQDYINKRKKQQLRKLLLQERKQKEKRDNKNLKVVYIMGHVGSKKYLERLNKRIGRKPRWRYYCKKCKHRHYDDTKIGKEHYKYKTGQTQYVP